jgi:hypothetical protein
MRLPPIYFMLWIKQAFPGRQKTLLNLAFRLQLGRVNFPFVILVRHEMKRHGGAQIGDRIDEDCDY